MIRPDANTDQPQRHVLSVGCGMSTRPLVGDQECSIWQFRCLAVPVNVVDKKSVVRRRSDPSLAAIAAEDQTQPAVPRSIRSMQANECSVAEHVETGGIEPHADCRRFRPSLALIRRPGKISFRTCNQ